MFKKFGLALLYILSVYFVFVYRQDILQWIQQTDSVVVVTLIAMLMALFPIIPYPVVGGVIGAAFGPVLGGTMTWVGSAAASILMFLFVRYGFQEWGVRLLHSRKGIGKVTELFERNAFLTILFTRLLPFIPSILINTYAALSRVSFTSYAIASSIGKIPAMLLFVMIGDSLMTEPRNILLTVAVYGVFLIVTLSVYQLWRRSQGTRKAEVGIAYD